MRLLAAAGLLLITLSGNLQAQKTQGGPYLIPQTVFVGDPGRLVLPLGSPFAALSGEVLEAGDLLPRAPDLVITRIELENQGGIPQLIIDFIPYAPGSLSLPPIKIGGVIFSDLTVTIASILDMGAGSPILSSPASPLAAPGTMMLICGILLGILLTLTGILAFGIRGIPGLRSYGERLRRRRAIRRLIRSTKQMGIRLFKNEAPELAILQELSREFRLLLSLLSGMDCMTMVPGEFLSFPPLLGQSPGPFLRSFFHRSDALRFSGLPIARGDAMTALEEVAAFAAMLENPVPGKGKGA